MEPFADPFNGKRDKRKTPTGFQQLDAGLGGGLSSGLHCLGAVSSLGKSTFALQMADSMALRGCGVIYYSLEMSSGDINAKSISD
jgi:replicative DNA helicase